MKQQICSTLLVLVLCMSASHIFAIGEKIVILDNAIATNTADIMDTQEDLPQQQSIINHNTPLGASFTETHASGDAPSTKPDNSTTKANTTEVQKPTPYKPPCDLTAQSGICLFSGRKIMLPDASAESLVFQTSFDSSHPVDLSRVQNHPLGVVPPGVSRNGRGASASFDGTVSMVVPSSNAYKPLKDAFTLMFWLYMVPDLDESPKNIDCRIVQLSNDPEPVFWLGINPFTREYALSVRGNRINLRSLGKTRIGQWAHLALTYNGETVTFYLNGVKDIQTKSVVQDVSYTDFSLNVGLHPTQKDSCYVPFFMDDLQVFSRAQPDYAIEAVSFPALGSVEARYIQMGCVQGCRYFEAIKACNDPYHLCYENELYAGGLQAALQNGYVSKNSQLWLNVNGDDGIPIEKIDETATKLAICCLGA